jgi:hypothetical protein
MPVTEYEVRLYPPQSRRPLFFTRADSPLEAQSMARRWQAARPDCRVFVVSTTEPRPLSVVEYQTGAC